MVLAWLQVSNRVIVPAEGSEDTRIGGVGEETSGEKGGGGDDDVIAKYDDGGIVAGDLKEGQQGVVQGERMADMVGDGTLEDEIGGNIGETWDREDGTSAFTIQKIED